MLAIQIRVLRHKIIIFPLLIHVFVYFKILRVVSPLESLLMLRLYKLTYIIVITHVRNIEMIFNPYHLQTDREFQSRVLVLFIKQFNIYYIYLS